MGAKRYLIIGDGAAGTTAAQHVRSADPTATITIFSDDPHAAYFRAALTNYLLGELREEQLWAVPPTFYEENSINRILARVASVDTQRSQLWLSQGGRPQPYDALLIGAGARARPPAFDGAWLPGVMTMRTLQDVRRVMDLIKLRGLRSAVVVGGGPLALEWAHGLTHRGVKVTMVVREQRFLPGVIDAVASDLLLARLRHAGVEVRVGDELHAAVPGRDGRVAGVVTKSGERMACELVAVAIGVVCNSDFLQGSGIALLPNGGVEVDAHMRTSIPNVFACGDIAAVKGKLLQLWEPARLQARVAAGHMTGSGKEEWAPGAHYMATRLYDLDVASIGEVSPPPAEAAGVEEIVDFPQRTGRISYRKLSVKDGRLVGALLFGEREARVRKWGRAFKHLIDERVDVSRVKRELQDPAFDIGGFIQTNVLTEKPSQGPGTQASPQGPTPQMNKIKGTHAIRLSDLPPLPAIVGSALDRGTTDKGTKLTPQMPAPTLAKGTQGLSVMDAETGLRVFVERAGARVELLGPTAILGSDPASAVALSDPQVSYTHAQVTRNGGHVYIRDLGSASGTWVNGAPVTVPKRLRDGDKIRLGATDLVMRLEGRPDLSSAPASTLPPASAPLSGEATPHLEVRSGQSLGLGFELTTTPATIGRDPTCSIRLDDESIAQRHAVLQMTQGQWAISDSSGRGSTVHNGAPVPPGVWAPLKAGDMVLLGEVVVVYAVRHAHISLQHAPRGSVATGAPVRGSAPSPACARCGSALPPQGAVCPVCGHHAAPEGRAPAMTPPPAERPQQQAPRARLSIRQGGAQGNVAELADHTVIGNQPGKCHLVVHDPLVFPQHLEIVKRPDGFYARALDPRIGTSFRGQMLGPMPVKLTSGDVLMLGPRVALLFEGAP